MKHTHLIAILAILLAIWLAWPAGAATTERAVTVLGSAARTATTASDNFTNTTGNANVGGAYLILDVTGLAVTPTITLTVQAIDPVSGKYVAIFEATTGVTTTGTNTYLIYSGVGAASDGVTQIVSRPLPPMWRVSVAHANTDPITYSVGALLLD